MGVSESDVDDSCEYAQLALEFGTGFYIGVEVDSGGTKCNETERGMLSTHMALSHMHVHGCFIQPPYRILLLLASAA